MSAAPAVTIAALCIEVTSYRAFAVRAFSNQQSNLRITAGAAASVEARHVDGLPALQDLDEPGSVEVYEG